MPMKSFFAPCALVVSMGFAAPFPVPAQGVGAKSLARPPFADFRVETLVEKLRDGEIAWQTREKIENELKIRDSQAVLLAVLDDVTREMPSMSIHSGMSNVELDSRFLSPQWRVFYSMHRVWNFHVRRPTEQVGRALVAKLGTTKNNAFIISQLHHAIWVPEAEAPLSALLKSDDSEARWAARALLDRVGDRYLPFVKKKIKAMPARDEKEVSQRSEWLRDALEALHSHRYVARQNRQIVPSLDAEIVRLGFEMLPRLEEFRAGLGYFLALDLGDYLAQEFKADQHEARFQQNGNLNETFFAQASKNALAWWKINRARFGA